MENFAVMNLAKGEEVAAGYVSGHIPGTGCYKFLAKKKRDGKYEWAHFTERDSGLKENVYRGEVAREEELKLVVSIMNKNLKMVFGAHAEMKEAKFEIRPLGGKKMDDSIN